MWFMVSELRIIFSRLSWFQGYISYLIDNSLIFLGDKWKFLADSERNNSRVTCIFCMMKLFTLTSLLWYWHNWPFIVDLWASTSVSHKIFTCYWLSHCWYVIALSRRGTHSLTQENKKEGSKLQLGELVCPRTPYTRPKKNRVTNTLNLSI